MMEHDNVRKKCTHVCVTGSPCCTVEKKILYWGNKKINTKKREDVVHIHNGILLSHKKE